MRMMILLCFVAAGFVLADQPNTMKIDSSGFNDGSHHWRRIRDDTRMIQAEPEQSRYRDDQIPDIVANLLLFQRDNGGWPKDYDMVAILTDAQRRIVRETHSRSDTSFDNHNVHSQVDYLARAYTFKQDPAWRSACERGLDFMLTAQYANGGFPQKYPNPKGYSRHITFNDGVMIGILTVLREAALQQPHWRWLDPTRREKCRAAWQRGIVCILNCQIRVQGQRTGWGQQHDSVTYAAESARTFELVSYCSRETSDITQFLMEEPNQTPEIMTAINSAVQWLRSVQLSGLRTEKVSAAAVEFQRHRADFDIVVVVDPHAKPIWARHYEIGTNRPIFSGRDGVKRYSLAEIDRERRTGSPWYGHWPEPLLTRELPRWQKRLKQNSEESQKSVK